MATLTLRTVLLSALFILSALILPSVSQLLGCDEVRCPIGEYNGPTCSVGNTTTGAIGVSNVSLPITDQPLTWTLMLQPLNNGQKNTFERDFFLGTPATLDLKTRASSETQLCAIFFNGAATKIIFPGPLLEYAQGTCDDALTAPCANDLRKQAQSFTLEGHNNTITDDSTSFCTELGDMLRKNAPQSCTVASDHQWIDVQAQPLTGSDIADPVQIGNCTPTTGKDYALTQIESFRIDANSFSEKDFQPITLGVTPILTAMWDPKNGTVVTSDLSCLKVMGSKHGAILDTDGDQHRNRAGQMGAAVGFGTVLIGMIWFTGWACVL